MKRIFDAVHNINVEDEEVIRRSITEGSLSDYVIDLIQLIEENDNKRQYKFESDKVEVNTLITEIFQSRFDDDTIILNSDRIATRLVNKEKATQDRYSQIMDLQKGSLIQSIFEKDDKYLFLIAKVEHEEFLDSEDFNRQIGLPFERRILKTCLVEIIENYSTDNESTDYQIENIYLADSNNRIAAYWYSDFLEMIELNSDEKNTKDAFKIIEREIVKQTKKVSPQDYNLLRNNLVGYFKTQDDFTISGLVENVFGNYVPESDSLDMENIKESIIKLPEEKNFDSQFCIVKNSIKARRSFKVTDKIELKFNDHIERMKHIIFAKEENGEKYIYIKTENEEVYNMFKY